MSLKRIIPVLLLKDDELYKTVCFDHPKYVGDPINAVKIFNEKEVDELIILDIDATRKNKKPNYQLLSEIASQSFIPMCYGGGVKDIEMFKRLVQLGYERLCINSAFYKNKKFVEECVEKFGSSSVIIGVDYKTINGKEIVYTESGKLNTGIGLMEFVNDAEKIGAGEILLHSIDRDGMYSGVDLGVAEKIAENTDVPLIVCGGAKSISDIENAFKINISAVAVGSLFVFYGKHRAVLINYPDRTKIELFD